MKHEVLRVRQKESRGENKQTFDRLKLAPFDYLRLQIISLYTLKTPSIVSTRNLSFLQILRHLRIIETLG